MTPEGAPLGAPFNQKLTHVSTEKNTEGAPLPLDKPLDNSRQTSRLSSRGIGAKPCRDCCQRIQRVTEQEITGLLGQVVVEALQEGVAEGEESVLAFIPGGRPTVPPGRPAAPVTRVPPAVRLLPARAVPVAGVIIGGSALIEAIVARTVALETLSAVALLLDSYFQSSRQNGDCETCVRDRMWGQDNPQVRERPTSIRRRV